MLQIVIKLNIQKLYFGFLKFDLDESIFKEVSKIQDLRTLSIIKCTFNDKSINNMVDNAIQLPTVKSLSVGKQISSL